MSQPALYRRTKEEQVVPADEKYSVAASSSSGSSGSSSSSTTTVKVFPDNGNNAKATLRRYSMEQIKQLYHDCLGRPMPAPISAAVLRDLDAGTPSAYYKYALTETMFAPRPSWRYATAIVARCKAQLIDPMELVY